MKKMIAKYQEPYILEGNGKERIINNWLALFPERKQKDDVDKIIERISNKKLEDFYIEYHDERNVVKQINDLFADLDRFCCKELVDEICANLYCENKWIYFCAPILYLNVEMILNSLKESKIIANVEELLEKVIADITDKLSGQSYRVLVNALSVVNEAHRLVGENEEDRGQYFSKVLLKDKDYLKELFLEYPELFRVMNRTTRYNLQYVVEIIKNTEQEYQKISDQLGKGATLGKIEAIRLGSGDSHNNGKTVSALMFDNGQKLMYKPRSLKIEESYGALIEWMNQNVPACSGLDYCKVYSVKDAGWVEYIENEECKSQDEIREFYEKTGELLCILYTLSAKDFHCENLIARKNQPILIDMETLIHVDVIGGNQEKEAIEEKISSFINNSVYATALLPTTLLNYNTDNSMEIGGISSGRKRISPFPSHVLKNAGTDKVTIENEYKEVPLNQNLPVYKGEKIGAIGYFECVKDSFKRMYEWIESNKEKYIEKIYEIFGQVECRVIYKTTNNYTQLLTTSYHPSLLHNETDREVYFHRIGLLYDEKEELSVLYRDEVNAMMNGDVPVYLMRAMGKYTYNSKGEIIKRNIRKTPLSRIEEKVRNMSELDYKRQQALIYFSFMGCGMTTDMDSHTDVLFENELIVRDRYDFVEEAKDIAEHLISRSFSDHIKGKRQISWFGFQGMGQQGYAITPVGWDLYKGNCGVALFFFRLAEVTKEEKYLTYAKDILQSVEHTIMNAEAADYKAMGNGAFTGVTGYVYLIYKMLQRGWITEVEKQEKLRLAERMTDYILLSLETSDRFDVLTGLAGILGVYTSLYPYTNGNFATKALDIIKNTANLLLERCLVCDDATTTWFTNHDIGYVHGNTGIIVQLARANIILKKKEIEKTIKTTLQYERLHSYDTETQEWTLRENAHYFSWCNGIAGMVMGKMALAEAGIKDEHLKDEMEQMLHQLKATGFGLDVCLCHGDMGSLCILNNVARYLKHWDVVTGCHSTCEKVLEKKVKTNDIYVLEDWGLMTGATGIGLGLLEQKLEDSFLMDVMLLQ